MISQCIIGESWVADQINAADIRNIYAELKKEYLLMTELTCPAKNVFELTRRKNILTTFANSMAAMLSTGYCGSKFIRIDDVTAETSSITVVFDKQGKLIFNAESTNLTRFRCALMSALSIDFFFKGTNLEDLSVGLIGAGRTNFFTYSILKFIFGIKSFIVKASPNNPEKGRLEFQEADRVYRVDHLSNCDIIIECATNNDRNNVVEIRDLIKSQFVHAQLFIAQNSGWLFGPSFRKFIPGFTDHISQINQRTHVDYDWPWDETIPCFDYDIRDSRFHIHTCPHGAIVYLTGIATADIVVAVEAYKLAEKAKSI